MWTKSHSKTVTGANVERLWNVWTNVNQWHRWQLDVERAELHGAFEPGSKFSLKPKGGPRVNIEITKVEPNKRFTDLTRFPGARMYGDHEFIQRGDALEIRTTMTITGPLSFLWRKIVGEGVASSIPMQTEQLLAHAHNE